MNLITNNYPNLRGEIHDLFDIIESGKGSTIFKQYLEEIWSTWRNVEAAMNKT